MLHNYLSVRLEIKEEKEKKKEKEKLKETLKEEKPPTHSNTSLELAKYKF